VRRTGTTLRALIAAAVAAVTVGLLPTVAKAADEKPTETEIGVDAETIHIATVADVDNSISPGLFQGGVDGVTGAVKFINANGGIAGRKLVLDFYDSKLNPNEARNGIIKACENDFAMVGNGMFLLGGFEDAVNCTDKAGQPVGIPDIPSVATNDTQDCSPVTYPSTGSSLNCDTLNSDPQKFTGQTGDSKYYVKKYGPKLSGPLVFSNDSASTARASSVLGLYAKKGGIDITSTHAFSSRDPQSAFTPLIQQMKSEGANYNLTGQPVDNVIAMRQEAQLQGLTDPKIVWTCQVQCYDKKTVAAGEAMADTRIVLNFLPFTETKSNKMLTNFVKYVGKDKVNGFAVWGWISTLLFQQVANDVVKEKGINGLTRSEFLTALKNTHEFSAGGMWGTSDPGNRLVSPCFMILKFDGSKYVREYPKKPGTFDCKASNRQTVERPASG
jgi:ABC-type branched-subunit amino acid transport system substrate-binding protein